MAFTTESPVGSDAMAAWDYVLKPTSHHKHIHSEVIQTEVVNWHTELNTVSFTFQVGKLFKTLLLGNWAIWMLDTDANTLAKFAV